jgi:hypothetical protein
MRFLMIWTPETNAPPPQQHIETMNGFIEESFKSGALLATGGLLSPSAGARVRRRKGEITVTDGPYAESKEVIAGFALMQARSKAAAIEHAKDFVRLAGDGETVIHVVADGPPEALSTQEKEP